jgi:hypothetical protein
MREGAVSGGALAAVLCRVSPQDAAASQALAWLERRRLA